VTVTATGLLAGTPAYLAPEVARGEDPLPGSDVFALGATLYTAVEGAPPFGEGDNPLAVLHAVALGEVSPPRNAGPLAPVLMSLLSVDVGARPTMREAARALADVAAGRAPRLPGPPGATKVLPSPGAEATAVLSGPAAASARPAQARPPQPRPQPARARRRGRGPAGRAGGGAWAAVRPRAPGGFAPDHAAAGRRRRGGGARAGGGPAADQAIRRGGEPGRSLGARRRHLRGRYLQRHRRIRHLRRGTDHDDGRADHHDRRACARRRGGVRARLLRHAARRHRGRVGAALARLSGADRRLRLLLVVLVVHPLGQRGRGHPERARPRDRLAHLRQDRRHGRGGEPLDHRHPRGRSHADLRLRPLRAWADRWWEDADDGAARGGPVGHGRHAAGLGEAVGCGGARAGGAARR